MKIQNYKDGEIHRTRGVYLFMRHGQIIGRYQSIEELTHRIDQPIVLNNKATKVTTKKQKTTRRIVNK